ncbi:hypothetical protein GC101_11000 [Paenibacillus sp. LMG 31459]|uniref:Uncharacterized protein n=1 Tax=Paenibacillus phytohabitans TaxID=2654978 RepID=A0ABX1YF39_9BACL|nr:hypothetical protein [Paenibacillus phytohabitans]NOU79406.1 hypothetical protein [Paenibacillus phytohabitans]
MEIEDTRGSSVHPNKYIREYTRHRYIVTRETFTPIELSLPEGDVLEKIDLPELRKKRAVAERVGFKLADTYPSFTSYAPIENFADLNDDGWYEWGGYLQQASQKEPRLYLECLHCYVKANAVEKAQEIVREMTKAEVECDREELNGAIAYYRSEGLCSAFKAPEWKI